MDSQSINVSEYACDCLNIIPAIVALTDLDGKLVYVNKRFQEVTKYHYDDVSGRNPRILKSGKILDDTYDSLWSTITEGKIWKGEFLNKTKDDKLIWETATISPVWDKQDKNKVIEAVKDEYSLSVATIIDQQGVHNTIDLTLNCMTTDEAKNIEVKVRLTDIYIY